ncbi:MAG: DUF2786 domain-containing protein, partial [Acidimicrobiales bacterium]
VDGAVQAAKLGDDRRCRALACSLAACNAPGAASQVDAMLAGRLTYAVARAWQIGWMPADVHRMLANTLGPRHARVGLASIRAEAHGWAASLVASLDPRWHAQLDALRVRPGAGTAPASNWATAHGDDRAEGIQCAVECLAWLHRAPPLPRVCPAPGEAPTTRPSGPSHNTRILERVRALLAKAESTTFTEEAEALSAKAAELMARYAIDRAVLEHDNGSAPGAIRLGVDNPYASAKSLLLDRVATANRCRAVWSHALGFSTLIGYEAEREVVELLYTSLLVQATRALAAAGPQVDHRGRSRTRSFRQSFLVGYAVRIGARLQAAADSGAAAATAEHGSSLLPVLAARDLAVDQACDAAFPGLVSHALSATNTSGWIAGQAVAELADVGIRREMGASV